MAALRLEWLVWLVLAHSAHQHHVGWLSSLLLFF